MKVITHPSAVNPAHKALYDSYDHHKQMQAYGFRTWYLGIVPRHIRPFRKQAKFSLQIHNKWKKRFRSEPLLGQVPRLKAQAQELFELYNQAQLKEVQDEIFIILHRTVREGYYALSKLRNSSLQERQIMRKMASERRLP